jgi:hypothetical protein
LEENGEEGRKKPSIGTNFSLLATKAHFKDIDTILAHNSSFLKQTR